MHTSRPFSHVGFRWKYYLSIVIFGCFLTVGSIFVLASSSIYRTTAAFGYGALSSAKFITSFDLSTLNPPVLTLINESDSTISATVPYGTSITELTPSITVSPSAVVSPGSGVAKNFSSPVVYTVTAQDGSSRTYTVSIQVASAPISIPTSTTTIDETGATTFTGTDITDGGTINIGSKVAITSDTTTDPNALTGSLTVPTGTLTISGSTWGGVLLPPTLVPDTMTDLTATPEKLDTLISSLNTSSITYTGTVLSTVKVGDDTATILAPSGSNFTVSFVVSGGVAGQTLYLYRSTNGTTWEANSPTQTCQLSAGLVCTFLTDHLTYFAPVNVTTVSTNTGGGGGSNTNGSSYRGGGGGGGLTLPHDNCPNGDFSPSYYDGTCGSTPITLSESAGAPLVSNNTPSQASVILPIQSATSDRQRISLIQTLDERAVQKTQTVLTNRNVNSIIQKISIYVQKKAPGDLVKQSRYYDAVTDSLLKKLQMEGASMSTSDVGIVLQIVKILNMTSQELKAAAASTPPSLLMNTPNGSNSSGGAGDLGLSTPTPQNINSTTNVSEDINAPVIKYINVEHTVRIRDSKSFTSKVITILPKNTRVTILEDDGTWSKIQLDDDSGTIGYIRDVFLRDELPGDIAREIYEQRLASDPEFGKRYVNVTDTLRVHLEPLFASQAVTYIHRNDQVRVTEDDGTWAKIETTDSVGWVPTRFLSATPVPLQ